MPNPALPLLNHESWSFAAISLSCLPSISHPTPPFSSIHSHTDLGAGGRVRKEQSWEHSTQGRSPWGSTSGGTRRAEKGQHEKCTSAQQSRNKAPLLEVHHRAVSTPSVSQQDPSSGALSPPPRAHPCATPFSLPNTTHPGLLIVTCLLFKGLLQQE